MSLTFTFTSWVSAGQDELPEGYVLLDTMPDHLRESHRKAGNWGVWPHNGASREVCTREEAEEIVAADPDGYDHIVPFDEDADWEDEVEFVLPGKYHVCPACEGKGTLMHPSLRGVAITEEDRDRDWSPDEWEQYISGGYDVTCTTCDGKRVVLVPDRAACKSPDDIATLKRYDIDRENDRRERIADANALKYGY